MSIETASPEQQERFGALVLERLAGLPFASLTKTETDLLLFSCLVDAGLIDIDQPAFRLAQQLRTTPTKVNTLIYQRRLRMVSSPRIAEEAARYICLVDIDEVADRITLVVSDRFYREWLIDELHARGAYTDTSFNRDRLVMSAGRFREVLPAIMGTMGVAGLDRAVQHAALEAGVDPASDHAWTAGLKQAIVTKATADALVVHGPRALADIFRMLT